MSNIRIVNLASHTTPQVVEDNRKQWVAYGEDNDYYSFLIESYLQSATNNAAIRSISDNIFGEGICIEGLDKSSNEVKELRKFINLCS